MLTHNLLLRYEQGLEQRHGLVNHAEDQRRSQRLKQMVAAVTKAKESLSTLRRHAWRATQHSVKFLRWLRAAIRDQLAEAPAVLRLKALYAQL